MHTTTQTQRRLAMLGVALSAAMPATAQVTFKPIIAHNEQGRKEQPGQTKRTPSAIESALDPTLRVLGAPHAGTQSLDPRLLQAWDGGWMRGGAALPMPAESRGTIVGGSSGVGAVPAPGAGILVVLGVGMAWRRRKRSAAATAGEQR